MAASSAAALTSAVGSATNPTEVLYLVAQHFLAQAEQLLLETVTSDELLSTTSKLSPGSSVGKHLRHLADHYKALFDALEGADSTRSSSSSPTSSPPAPPPTASPTASSPSTLSPLRLDYDQRTRNVAAEHSHAAALAQFRQLRQRLDRLTGQGKDVDPDREVRLEATTPVRVEVKTSFARELWFASFHAVHHFALVRVIACGELGLTVPDDFGVAPSTLKHRESEASTTDATPLKL
ncbi:hypothetical protein JCM8097_000507 [Rhodosporidiobolus ruineniae]